MNATTEHRTTLTFGRCTERVANRYRVSSEVGEKLGDHGIMTKTHSKIFNKNEALNGMWN